MKKELEDSLGKEFIFMNRVNKDGNKQSIFIETKDGWYDLIHELCSKIQDIYNRYSVKPNIVIDEVKEKYGVLHFDFYYHGAEPIFHKEIEALVDAYENKSETICENCGQEGKLLEISGWLSVKCPRCASAQHDFRILR